MITEVICLISFPQLLREKEPVSKLLKICIRGLSDVRSFSFLGGDIRPATCYIRKYHFFLRFHPDFPLSIELESYLEIGVEMGVEVGEEVGEEGGVEVGEEVGVEVGEEVGVEVGVEVGEEVGVKVGVEVGEEVGVEVDEEVGEERSGRGSGRGSGRRSCTFWINKINVSSFFRDARTNIIYLDYTNKTK